MRYSKQGRFRVALVEKREQLLPFLDREIVTGLQARMEDLGVRFFLACLSFPQPGTDGRVGPERRVRNCCGLQRNA